MRNLLSLTAALICTSAIAQTDLVNENFNNGFPSNWARIDVDGQTPLAPFADYTLGWDIMENHDSTAVSDSVISATSYFSNSNTANDWLITPQVTLGGGGNFISWQARSFDGSYPNDYVVLLSKTGANEADFTDTIQLVSQESPYWQAYNVRIDSFANETVYIGIKHEGSNGYVLQLDNINVRKDDPTATNNYNSDLEFNIFPNPTVDYFTLNGVKLNSKINIYNQLGKLEFSTYFNGQVDVQNLSKGIYFVEVLAGNTRKTKKFLKK